MKNKFLIIITSIATVIPIAAGVILWSKLPDDIAIHFDSNGNADKWCYKAWAVFGLPLFALAAHLFCVFMTAHDPKGRNIGEKIYNAVIWICPICSLTAGVIIYTHSLALPFSPFPFLQIALGILIMIIGNYLPKCRQNYTIGIKLPWTLSDKENWNSTHRAAGRIWVVGGIIIVFNAFIDIPAVSFAVVLLMVLFPLGYSFVYHKSHN